MEKEDVVASGSIDGVADEFKVVSDSSPTGEVARKRLHEFAETVSHYKKPLMFCVCVDIGDGGEQVPGTVLSNMTASEAVPIVLDALSSISGVHAHVWDGGQGDEAVN